MVKYRRRYTLVCRGRMRALCLSHSVVQFLGGRSVEPPSLELALISSSVAMRLAGRNISHALALSLLADLNGRASTLGPGRMLLQESQGRLL